jgi:L-fucose isomerase-like protein
MIDKRMNRIYDTLVPAGKRPAGSGIGGRPSMPGKDDEADMKQETKKEAPVADSAATSDLPLGFVCLAREVFDIGLARSMAEQARRRLGRVTSRLVVPHDRTIETLAQAEAVARSFEEGQVEAVLVLCGTFASAELVLHLAERLRVPLIIWTVPEPELGDYLHLNSLVGGNAVASALYKLGFPYKFFHRSVEDEEFYQALGRYLDVLRLARALRALRIGLVGARPAGFQDITFDELSVRKKLGLQVHTIELAELFARVGGVPEEEAAKLSRKWKSEHRVNGPTPEELINTGRLVLALRELSRDNMLDVMAVRCLPEIWQELGITACAALSFLADEGLLAACEADVLGAATMYAHRWLSGGQAPFISDLISVDPVRNAGRLWHCGLAPASLANRPPVCLSCHYTRKSGVVVEFSLKAGPVTVSRLDSVGDDFRMLISSGEATGDDIPLNGTAADVIFKENVTELLDVVVNQGFPHHFAMSYGDITGQLRDLCTLLGIRVVSVQSH